MNARDIQDGAPAVLPDEAGYDEGTGGFQTGFTLSPDAVFPVSSADGIAAALRYALAHGLPVTVQATGHGLPGSARGGVLISTRRMSDVLVDPVARTARIGAGACWADVVAAAAPHGLVPLNGSAPGVGAVSYTLGGGLGILGRTFGYAADHVRALDVVTVDGRRLRVTPGSEPGLFWGLRGGGGDLAVVTALETALFPVSEVYGGSLMWDGAVTEPAEVLDGYERWTRSLPDEVTTSLAAAPYPDLPFLPEALRGRYVLSVRVASTGGAAAGERLVAPLRALGRPMADSLRTMPYADTPSIHNDPPAPHPYWGDSVLLRALDGPAATRLLRVAGPGAPTMTVVQINHLGGALAKEPDVANAVPYRDARFLVRMLTVLDGAGRAAARARTAEAFDAVAPWTMGRSLNFSFGGGDRTAGLHGPAATRRLAELKAAHDPSGLLRGNGTCAAGWDPDGADAT